MVAGLYGLDLNVIPSNGQNQIDQTGTNIWKGFEIGGGILGAVVAVAAAPLTGGGSLAIASAVAGGVLAVGTTVVSIATFAVRPVTISNLLARDGYNFEIGGGLAQGHYDTPQRFVITGYDPLTVKWHNNTSGNEGTVTAGS